MYFSDSIPQNSAPQWPQNISVLFMFFVNQCFFFIFWKKIRYLRFVTNINMERKFREKIRKKIFEKKNLKKYFRKNSYPPQKFWKFIQILVSTYWVASQIFNLVALLVWAVEHVHTHTQTYIQTYRHTTETRTIRPKIW